MSALIRSDHRRAESSRRTWLLPRDLHPAAWWCWALGLSIAASRTTNPIYLAGIIIVAATVVAARRSESPWALSFRLYVWLGVWIIILRLAFRIVFGGGTGETVLVRLPTIPLPSWMAGIELFGPITLEAMSSGFSDGLRLATMIICVGAANALANPKRLLKSMPAALYEIGTAVTIAVSVFPQLAESVQRVRRARTLRGGDAKRRHVLRTVAIPVLEDALERSARLAASMDARGYGRTLAMSRRARHASAAAMIVGLGGVSIGVFAILDGTAPRVLAQPLLLIGLIVAAFGFFLSGRPVQRVRYRPDRWRAPELAVAAAGIAVAATFGLAPVETLQPVIGTFRLDHLEWFVILGISFGFVPLVAAPLPEPVNDPIEGLAEPPVPSSTSVAA